MQNNELKSLVTQMHENLIELIDQQKHATKEQVVSYLNDAITTIEKIDDEKINSIQSAKNAFTNAYKKIADESLNSYSHTNNRFEELTQLHEKTITECKDPQINLDDLTAKFNEIQSHMSDEVQKANEVIQHLTTQVKALEEKSSVDPLTQVYNRGALDTYLNSLCSNKNFQSELHLLIIDIDDFKVVNDTYGHVAGDKILIYIANILKKTLRDGDKIFRYGGEEFIIILNRIDNAACTRIANRILQLVSSNNLIYKGKKISVTASIGATAYNKNDTPDSLIARADKALYSAKNDGKNKMYSDMK